MFYYTFKSDNEFSMFAYFVVLAAVAAAAVAPV